MDVAKVRGARGRAVLRLLFIFVGVMAGIYIALVVAYFRLDSRADSQSQAIEDQAEALKDAAQALGTVEDLQSARAVIDDPLSTPAEREAAREEVRRIVAEIAEARRQAEAEARAPDEPTTTTTSGSAQPQPRPATTSEPTTTSRPAIDVPPIDPPPIPLPTLPDLPLAWSPDSYAFT